MILPLNGYIEPLAILSRVCEPQRAKVLIIFRIIKILTGRKHQEWLRSSFIVHQH